MSKQNPSYDSNSSDVSRKLKVVSGLEVDRVDGKTRLYVHDVDSHVEEVVELSLPHLISSNPILFRNNGVNPSLQEVLDELKTKVSLKDATLRLNPELRIRQVHNNSFTYQGVPIRDAHASHALSLGRHGVLMLSGPASMKDGLHDVDAFGVVPRLKRNANDSRNSEVRMHWRQVGKPFARVEIGENQIQFLHKQLSLEEVLQARHDAWDSEFEGWESSLDFVDLEVSTVTLRNYVNQQMAIEMSKKKAMLAKLSSIETGDVDLQSEVDEHIEEVSCALAKEKSAQALLHSAGRSELVDLVRKYKFAADVYRPFAICHITGPNAPNFYFTTYPMPELLTTVKSEFGEEQIHNIVTQDADDLQAGLEQVIDAFDPKYESQLREYYEQSSHRIKTADQAARFLFAIAHRAYNPLTTYGHNIGSFDLPNNRGEIKSTPLLMGVSAKPPRLDANLQFFWRSVIPGRYNIDTCLLMQKFFAGSKDNKLKTLIKLLYGIADIKDLSYADTTQKRVEAELGNVGSAYDNAVYCMKDTIYHYHGARPLHTPIVLLARLVMESPEVVCSTSYKRISRNLAQMQSLQRRGTYLDERFGEFRNYAPTYVVTAISASTRRRVSTTRVSDQDFDLEKEKNRVLFSVAPARREVARESLFDEPKFESFIDEDMCERLASRAGLFDDVQLYYLSPFTAAWASMSKNVNLGEVIDYINTGDSTSRIDRWTRFVAAQGVQRDYLGIISLCALNYSPSRCTDSVEDAPWHVESFIFEKIFGRKLLDVSNRVASMKNEFQDACKRFDVRVVNSQKITALQVPSRCREDFDAWVRGHHYGVALGDARVVSLAGQGRFIAYIDGDYLSQGVDIRFSRGLKNNLDAKVASSLLDSVLKDGDFAKAIDLISETARDLREHQVPVDDLLYVTESCAKSPQEYSSRALSRDVIEKIRADVRGGDRFAWGYTEEGVAHAPDVFERSLDQELYLRAMFGEQSKRGWNYRQYTLEGSSRTIKASTSIGALAEALLVLSEQDSRLRKEKALALSRIITGTASSFEYDLFNE